MKGGRENGGRKESKTMRQVAAGVGRTRSEEGCGSTPRVCDWLLTAAYLMGCAEGAGLGAVSDLV